MMDRRAAALRLVAFLNSLHVPDGDDHLADGRAGAWLAAWLGDDTCLTVEADDREHLRRLREGLRRLVATNAGLPPDGDALAPAEAVLRAFPLVLELGTAELVGAQRSDPVARAVAGVVAAYLAVRAGEEWSRVKTCAGPDCRWAFVDTSRNRSRRWCAMAGCGNRAKNRGWRERQRETG